MSRRDSSRASSVYSQDSGRGGQNTGGSILGGSIRTRSPEPLDYGTHAPSPVGSGGRPPAPRPPSSNYSAARPPSQSSTGRPPAPRPPSSGYSAARPPSRSSTGGGSGSGGRPATPAHASLMSAYGHSSYAGSQAAPANRPSSDTTYSKTFMDSAPQTSSARGPHSGTSYSRTFIDPAPQVGISQRGSADAGNRAQETRPAFNHAFSATMDTDSMRMVLESGRSSKKNRGME
ncbi:hypothetical protein C8A00DRAFT_34424 [Chaetomidium leptoderma]|uniref:Uncharacterized protein n=1 Tax=Chaetomidium leptoderma TaxID=669021 RepID=A0AAN6VM49_9PEZI|nr:hypothetical protein C8A00DRAFT_34424 [Chaetomidium leptoderma]